MKECLEFLEKNNISKDDYLVVGCSSGPDSMCLLHLLHYNGYKVVCAHVNHNIRNESTKEYKFLKKYCKERDIIFEGIELEKNKKGNEQYYRLRRYSFYKDIADKYKTKYILTAHHGDDLIETILMRLSRGSNLKGYLGFSSIYQEDNYIFIKPLIFYTKKQILSYDKSCEVPFNLDKTNDTDIYTRNRFRHNVLPFLKKENKDVNRKYLQFSEELKDAVNYIDDVVEKAKSINYKDNKINISEFKLLDEYIAKKELENIFSEIYGNDINSIKKVHIANILSLIKKNKNFTLDLPKGKVLRKSYDELTIDKRNFEKNYEMVLDKKVNLPNGFYIEKCDYLDDNSNYTTRLSSHEIKLPLIVRTRKNGDSIAVKNMNGHKKIKTIFIDEKISQTERDSWPIVEDSNGEIIWIPGLRKSKFDKKINEKYDIILKYARKERINEE